MNPPEFPLGRSSPSPPSKKEPALLGPRPTSLKVRTKTQFFNVSSSDFSEVVQRHTGLLPSSADNLPAAGSVSPPMSLEEPISSELEESEQFSSILLPKPDTSPSDPFLLVFEPQTTSFWDEFESNSLLEKESSSGLLSAGAAASFPPSLRFHPTDVELVLYYLKRKIMGKKLPVDVIPELDIYKYAPWDLPDKSLLKTRNLAWYFFCPRGMKYSSERRTNRATEFGYWKTTGKNRAIEHKNQVVGMIKTRIFHTGKAPKGDRTDWVMHEYRIVDNGLTEKGIQQDSYVICKISQKVGPGPRYGAQYGKQFDEEEWDEKEKIECVDSLSVPVLMEPTKRINSVANDMHPSTSGCIGLTSESCLSRSMPSCLTNPSTSSNQIDTMALNVNNKIEPRIHDVYLSSRDEDTHASFTSHLCTSLQNAGIHVFKEHEVLQGEDKTSSSLLHAIEKSRISVVVFSRNYADSTWCLEELEKIMLCHRTTGQMVITVFCGVDPSEVRNQTGMFGEAFEYLLKELSVKEEKEVMWRKALCEAGGISGFVINDFRNKSEDVKNVVEHVTRLVEQERISLFIADHPVGVESRVQHVIQLINNQQADDVLLLGLWGMGGIGKTTIAKAIYNQIGCEFDGSSFLQNIRETWQREWHVSLQEQLLSDIFLSTGTKIPCIESGKMILKDKLRHKRVLVVLDDVNELEQLKALCGSPQWFGPRSMVIITTRDKYLLNEHGVDLVHTIKEMDVNESLELFSWHAFKQATPRKDFAALSKDIVSYSGGLPLALKVIGKEVSGKEIIVCNGILDELKKALHPEIQKVLKRSYDHLKDDAVKDMFLDIAFFFIGMDRNDVIEALQGFGCFSETKFTILVDQCLATVDENNNVGMHVLLREMGKQIFREQSQMETGPRIYDVFLSFRGVDTRPTFTSHLYTYLQNAGLYVFKDDISISRGDRISKSLLQAIGSSRISVIVLSNNYANSRCCMVEMEKIMECHRTTSQLVVPVFYGVEPFEVRKQEGMFGEAFNDLLRRISIEEDRVQTWKTALTEIGAIFGPVITNFRNESEDIKKLVEDITRWLDRTNLFIADHPVGVKTRVQEAIELLNQQQPKDVRLLGICGMGGIGKTTIAKSLYNQIGHNFEARSILLDINEFWEQNSGQVSLQKQILSEVYKTMKITINSIDKGKEILKERLRQKRVLLVLDDINKLEQLNALCGNHEWFYPGSCIIITTRDESLVRVHGLDPLIYRMKGMDESESVELFSWYAFRQARPKEDFDGLCRHLAAYCGGLPIALQIIGSQLFTEGIKVWESVLEDLKSYPNHEIHKKLKISYDGLCHHDEKEIFLHIACFFIGMDRNDVIHILMDCGFTHPEFKISSLVKRSLVTVDNENRLGIHDLLRNMGREIVREESPEEPEKRRRLCHRMEVINVLSRYTGTEAIEGLTLKLPRNHQISFWTNAFEKMKKLRLLQFSSVRLFGDFKYISRELTWLNWHEFPLRHTPEEFYQGSLVSIELKYSKLKQVWKEIQLLKKLKILNLSHSHHLTQTPNFSFLPNLQKLILEDCRSLSSVSDTIGNLKEILLINLKDCTSLCDLPRSIYKLTTLKTFILSGCSKIDLLQEDLEQMENLTALIADNTAIKRVPISVVRLKNIGYISLCGYEGLSRNVFPSLIWSWMSPKNNLSSQVQTSSSFSYLVSLELSSSSLPGLSYILEVLPKLQSLWVKCDLEQLDQHVEGILDTLHAINSKELGAMPSTSQVPNIKTSESIDCCSHVCILASKGFTESLKSSMEMNSQDSSTLEELISQIGSGLLPVDNNPDPFPFRNEGSSVNFTVSKENGRNLKTMMCIVYYSSIYKLISEGLKNVLIINYTKTTIQIYKPDALTSKDEEWHRAISNLGPGNKARVMVVFGNGFNVKKTEVYLTYAGPNDKNMDHCHPSVMLDRYHEPVFDNKEEEKEFVKPPKRISGTNITSKARKRYKKSRKDQKLHSPQIVKAFTVKEPNLSANADRVVESSTVNVSKKAHGSICPKDPCTSDLTVQEIALAPDKGKAPIDANTPDANGYSDEDPFSELESFLSGHRCSSPKPVEPLQALITLESLLKYPLAFLFQDPVLYQQLDSALKCMDDAAVNLPVEVLSLVENMKSVIHRFPSTQETINLHIKHLEKKKYLSQNCNDCQNQLNLLITKISEGRSDARRLDQEIIEVRNVLDCLIRNQEKLAADLGEYEDKKRKVREEGQRLVEEGREVMSAIKRSKPNFIAASKEQTKLNKDWEQFRNLFADRIKNYHLDCVELQSRQHSLR